MSIPPLMNSVFAFQWVTHTSTWWTSPLTGIMNYGKLHCVGSQMRLKAKFGMGYQLQFHCTPGRVQEVERFMAANFSIAAHVETYAGQSCDLLGATFIGATYCLKKDLVEWTVPTAGLLRPLLPPLPPVFLFIRTQTHVHRLTNQDVPPDYHVLAVPGTPTHPVTVSETTSVCVGM